ncbi:hypothetical protein [Luteipulveratus mongoliensis]|uniref:Uncharacterized protein n=1 Tax=Luteipulveratus mongoliensis TaxID=571913 RepID=A0A0K1JIR3_9MICO|nr:hypothetical protein [Luteipulveratus mongoliensis]AKU16614.1 hypothetical protein VV02_13325 [Luteipulveratus mongoliensis]
MPGNDLQITGGITQALLDALNQIHTSITAGLVGPDGQPSKTAIYMHLPVGQPVDPKMYANPWTPAGGSAYAAVTSTGAFTPAAPPPVADADAKPPAQQLAAIPAPDPKLQLAISSAFNTAQRVDNMLMVTDKGVAVAWPQRTVSIEYFTALEGMQAEPIPEPSDEIKKRIADAEKTLYTLDADGNFTGYTPRHASYRHNQKALADARSEQALAYSQAMADPVAGQAWPVTSAKYENAVTQAYNDWRDMGGQEIEDAINTLQSVGGSAAAALIAKARKMFDDYSVGLGGAVSTKVPWSYIDPVSWWDHSNHDFGAMRITAKSSQYQAGGGGGEHSFAHSFYRDESSSNSGSAGFSFFWGVSADASHSETSHDDGTNTDTSGWTEHHDQSSSATVEFEWFMASIERPWLLGDLFHMDGWYLAGQKKGAISDGTIEGQIGDVPKLLPMIPKSFVVVRNVKITSDSWGSLGSSFQNAVDSSQGHTDSSSTSYGGSVGWFGLGGSYQHSESDANGAFTTTHDGSNGWSYTSTATGGTLELLGAQIVGWVGQIQPVAPRVDDPNIGKEQVDKPAPDPAKADGDKPAAPAPAAPAPAAPAPVPVPATPVPNA